jgi:hypothetical protein
MEFKKKYETGPIDPKHLANKNWEPASTTPGPDTYFNRVRDYLKKEKRVVEYEELERIAAFK